MGKKNTVWACKYQKKTLYHLGLKYSIISVLVLFRGLTVLYVSFKGLLKYKTHFQNMVEEAALQKDRYKNSCYRLVDNIYLRLTKIIQFFRTSPSYIPPQ